MTGNPSVTVGGGKCGAVLRQDGRDAARDPLAGALTTGGGPGISRPDVWRGRGALRLSASRPWPRCRYSAATLTSAALTSTRLRARSRCATPGADYERGRNEETSTRLSSDESADGWM